jgi:hypothetical protein
MRQTLFRIFSLLASVAGALVIRVASAHAGHELGSHVLDGPAGVAILGVVAAVGGGYWLLGRHGDPPEELEADPSGDALDDFEDRRLVPLAGDHKSHGSG